MGEGLDFLIKVGAAFGVLVTLAKVAALFKGGSERREDRASFRQITEGLRAENDRLRKDLASAEERRDFYRKLAHDQANQIMGLADDLSTSLMEQEMLRRRLGDPDNEPPTKARA